SPPLLSRFHSSPSPSSSIPLNTSPMNSTRSSSNTTTSLESYEETTSVIQMAELALICVFIGFIILCTALYICTRVIRHKHIKQSRQMEMNARDPLKEETTEKNNA
ncbi:hypothetical protein PFISCL1PPCAC_27301, partial [Pristionchus fissidentatus]